MRVLAAYLMLVSPAVALAQISPPELLQPTDDGWRWIAGGNEWMEVAGAVEYHAQIDTVGGDFTDPVADTVIVGMSWGNSIEWGVYVWRVAASDGNVWSDWSEVWTFESRFPAANEPDDVPQKLVVMERVTPNPSRGVVNIRFSVQAGREAEILLYDVVGREVATVYRGAGNGVQELQWTAPAQPAGAYFLVLRSGSDFAVQRIVVVK